MNSFRLSLDSLTDLTSSMSCFSVAGDFTETSGEP